MHDIQDIQDIRDIQGVQYREATVADIPDIERSRHADPTAGRADPRMTAYLERRHHPHLALPSRVAYVAVDDDAVAGYIAGHLTRRFECDGEVQYLFVAPQYRRTGVASALLRLVARWFVEQRASRVCVNVNVDSPPALPFYLRHGATPLNRYWLIWSDIGTLVDRRAEETLK